MTDKRELMLSFWSERARRYGLDPRANTADVWLRDLEIRYVSNALARTAPRRVLDFGCANGYSTLLLAEAHPSVQFVGVDLNPDMISIARQAAEQKRRSDVEFRCVDLLAQGLEGVFDFVLAIRVFQNIESALAQRRVLGELLDHLQSGGHLLYVESYAADYARINGDRRALGLPPLPIHQHLTLLTEDFDASAAGRAEILASEHLASSYYLVTRLVYSSLAQLTGEEIDYDHPIHRIAARIPQVGDYGPLRACLCRKRDR
jgi:SAM-dependent methyltransferase